jgi:amino acid transporter
MLRHVAVPEPREPTSPKRELTLFDCIGIGINGIVGSGIFVLPATLARRAGGAAPLAWVLNGAFCSIVALCFAEAAGRTSRQGGPYRYTFDAFGPTAGLLVGWITLVSNVLGYAAVARAFADHAATQLAPGRGFVAPLVVIALVAGLAFVNLLGARLGARTSTTFSALKAVALVAFCVFGLARVDLSAAAGAPHPHAGEPRGLLAAAFAGLFASTGFEYVPVPAAEAIRPKRDIGIATVASVLGATALYALVQLVAQAAAPGMGNGKTPVVDAAGAMFGVVGARVMLVAAFVSMFGFFSGSALVTPRYVESLAHDGFLPPLLARRSARWGTPVPAIVAVSVVVGALALELDFTRLADTSVVACIVQYVSTALAVIVMRRKLGPSTGFRLPLGPLVPVAAILGCVFFLASAEPRDLLVGSAVLAGGGLVGTVTRRALGARVVPADPR